jgi:hypothetical protein
VRTPALPAGVLKIAKPGDIGLVHADDGSQEKLTDKGDCGALFLDLEGRPVSMHNVLASSIHGHAMKYELFGIPLVSIMAQHTEFRDYFSSTEYAEQETHQQTPSAISVLPPGREYVDMKHFDTKIVTMEIRVYESERLDIAYFDDTKMVTTDIRAYESERLDIAYFDDTKVVTADR